MTRLRPEEFMDCAPTIHDAQVNINHENCPAGTDRKRRLYIRRMADKVVAYCHHCGRSGTCYDKSYVRPLSHLKEDTVLLKGDFDATQYVPNPAASFPADTQFDPSRWPSEALGWLLAYNMDMFRIKKYNIGYSPGLRRVILPVFERNTKLLVYWQGRAVFKGDTPKYRNVHSSLVAKPHMYLSPITKDPRAVIVEDILSAIRCYEATGMHSIALLGTSPSKNLAHTLHFAGVKKAYIWLDPDIAGLRGALKCHKMLSLSLDDVEIIRSDAQPKECSDAAIKEILDE